MIYQEQQDISYFALFTVCHYFSGLSTRSIQAEHYVIKNSNAVSNTSWHHKFRNKQGAKSLSQLRKEMTYRIVYFLTTLNTKLRRHFKNEIVVVAHLIEYNLLRTAPTQKQYCEMKDLRRRTEVLIRYLARLVTTIRNPKIILKQRMRTSYAAMAA